MYLIQKIEDVTVRYHDARHAIGSFVLKERTTISDYSIQDVADRTFTSKATVTRFAKTLGYSGWKEFIKAFRQEQTYEETHKGVIDVNTPFKAGDDPAAIAHAIRELAIESIMDTEEQLDINMLNRAVNFLQRAKRVVLFARTPNLYYAESFCRKLLSIGTVAEVVMSNTGLIASSLTREDCAVIISYSGNNPNQDPMYQLAGLKERRVPVIGITSAGDNYIRREADAVLTMSSRERLYSKLGNFSTEESLNYILNVLYAVYFARNYEANKQYKVHTARKLERGRTTAILEMMEREEL